MLPISVSVAFWPWNSNPNETQTEAPNFSHKKIKMAPNWKAILNFYDQMCEENYDRKFMIT